jgi:hypothetical protein
MKTKRQQQKTPTTKKFDLDLDAFLHSIIHLPIKDTNKHFIFNLGDTNDVRFNLTDFLDFNPIKSYSKLRVLSCTNGTIQDITFKFKTGPNMRLIFDSFYAPRKKCRLFNHRNSIMCGQYLFQTFNIEHYIDFFFLPFSFKIFGFLFFYFSFKNFVVFSWNFVNFDCYVLLIWEIWGSL